MRIGISLAGISYITTGRKRDFRDTYKNFYETIYAPLAREHTVLVYTTTYPNEFQDEFLKVYKPVKYQFLPFENSHPRSTFMSGLCLVEEENLDILITTRFDIIFNQKITDLNLDYTKFNILFKENYLWNSNRFVCDNLFVFPFKYLYALADAIEDIHYNGPSDVSYMHHVYTPLVKTIGEENVHFMSPELNLQESSFINKFYTLARTNG